MEDSDAEFYLNRLISEKYFVNKNPKSFKNINITGKMRYYEAKISSNPKYQNQDSTYGLKFGAHKTYWIIIIICIITSSKIIYDNLNGSDWDKTGLLITLLFFLSGIVFFGYHLIFENPKIEIQNEKLIYKNKVNILWKNVVTIGTIKRRSNKPPHEHKIVIGTKQKELIELDVSLLDTSVQNVIDIIIINVR